jgi:hypothetical protein
MAFKIERVIRRHRPEILITMTLLLLSISLILLGQGQLQDNWLVKLGGQLGFSLLVALVVRWLSVIFAEVAPSVSCDSSEYHEAIKAAQRRVWVCQTWLPGIERDSAEILAARVTDKRLLLLSFAPSSPIYGRIKGRGMKVSAAQHYSASSVKPFVKGGQTDCVRFNHGHHPGWIGVVDGWVFWGPTPVDLDSQSIEFLFHKHPVTSVEGAFWVRQFEEIWQNHSYLFDEERKYNPEL